MARTARTRTLLASGALVAIVSASTADAAAAPDDREQCANAAEQAQQFRDEGKYRRAREQMLSCARDACPGPIKSDCGKWLSELDRDAPTVVFGARDAKGDLFDVKVSMDGLLIQERLDGKPVLVDSGEHTFKFESAKDGVKEEKVLVRAAEKARAITVVFGSNVPASGGSGSSGAKGGADRGTSPPAQEEGSIVPALVVGGIGVLALGSFAFFGATGSSDVDDLQKCRPNCKEEDVDSARTKLIIADISLGVGIVALGVATYMFLTRPKVDTSKVVTTAAAERRPTTGTLRLTGLSAAPVLTPGGGGVAALGGTF